MENPKEADALIDAAALQAAHEIVALPKTWTDTRIKAAIQVVVARALKSSSGEVREALETILNEQGLATRFAVRNARGPRERKLALRFEDAIQSIKSALKSSPSVAVQPVGDWRPDKVLGVYRARVAVSSTNQSRKKHMTEDQIKHMVDRFLGWKLPANFSPDAGISFKADFNEGTAYPMKHEPTGTNLFDAGQADAMVRYLVEGMPHGS